LYGLNWGKSSKLFAELKKKGVKLGANASSNQELSPLLQVYYRAFLDLHRRRQWHTSGPQPITYQEMAAYIGLKFQMKFDQVARLIRFTEDLDDAYIKNYAEKNAK